MCERMLIINIMYKSIHAVTLVNLITTQGVKMMYDMNMFCFCYQR